MSLDDLGLLPRFASLPADALRALSEAAIERTYEPGAMLWVAGSRPGGLLVVLEGEVKIVRSRDGRQHVIHRGKAGATLGEVPLFTGGTYPASAIAVGRTRCLVLPRQRLDAAIAAHPAVAQLFLRGLARRIRALVERLDERSSTNIRTRVARWLLARSAGDPEAWFALGRTQEELAEELGTVREVVVRALAELREGGAIESDGRGRYRILRPEILEP